MGRPRRANKKPKSSISLDEELILQLTKEKQFGESYNDLVKRIFNIYLTSKDPNSLIEENKFLIETVEAQQKRLELLNNLNKKSQEGLKQFDR